MEIKTVQELFNALDLVLVQTPKAERVKMLKWFKETKNKYDNLYPLGYKFPIPENPVSEAKAVEQPTINLAPTGNIVAIPPTEEKPNEQTA